MSKDLSLKDLLQELAEERGFDFRGYKKTTLERRFRKATYNSIVEYMQRVRIEAAKQTLERERENVNEAMYKAGYNDSKAFRTTFKKLTGLSPLEYRNKYTRKEVLVEE